MFDRWFKGKKSGEAATPSDAEHEAWYDEKSKRMATALGPDHDQVLHAIIGYPLGGPLHTYFYLRGLPGTGLASKELARLGEKCPSNRDYDKFEFVVFTREVLSLDGGGGAVSADEKRDFLRGTLTQLAYYAENATLNPLATLEFPADFDPPMAGRCFIIDAYKPELFERDFGLMLVMEVHRDEMEFARAHGTAVLLEKLRAADAYPYSDPEKRASVTMALQ